MSQETANGHPGIQTDSQLTNRHGVSMNGVNNSSQAGSVHGQYISGGGQASLAGKLAGDGEGVRVFGIGRDARREEGHSGGRDGFTAAIDNVVAMVKV